MIEQNLLSKCRTDSERETALFLDRLGLKCLDLSFKIKDDSNIDLGEIDGVFLDDENQVIIIYDDSKDSTNHNSKISFFFSRCLEDKYEKQLYDRIKDIPLYPIYIIYIDKYRESGANISSVLHSFTEKTSIIFKDDFEYFDELSNKLGKWAKNDLYNKLDIFPPQNRIEIDAIKIFIGETPAYVFADKPNKILKYSYVSRRRGNDEGYQRMINFDRVKGIKEDIENGKIKGFPNSILLNSSEKIGTDKISRSHCPAPVKIVLPNHYSSCRIVDGQHRLISFSQLSDIQQTKYSIAVVLIDNMPNEEEIRMFLDINNNAKSVDPNLEYELISKLNWEINSKEHYIKLSIEIITELEKANPIKGNIYRGLVGETKKDVITLKSFADSIIRNKAGLIFDANQDIDKTVLALKKILIEVSKTISDKDYLLSNRGVDLICSFWSSIFLSKPDIDTNQIIDENIQFFIDAINKKIEDLKGNYGGKGFSDSLALIIKEVETLSSGKVAMATCKKPHVTADIQIKNISIYQGGAGRHKCAACAYEQGLDDAQNNIPKRDLENLSNIISFSQKTKRRHKDIVKAYDLGYQDGKNSQNA